MTQGSDQNGARRWWRVRRADIQPRALLWTLALFAASTGASFLSQSMGKTITAPLVFLLGVTVIGATQGLLHGVVAALCAAAIYNFAVTDPVFVFRLADADDLFPLLAFNLSALIAGSLAGRLKDRAAEAQRVSRELAALLEASKELQSVFSPSDLAATLPKFASLAAAQTVVLLINTGGSLRSARPEAEPLPDQDALDELHRHLAVGVVPEKIADYAIYPLKAASELLGALLVRHNESVLRAPAPSLDALVNMIALTLERCFLLERLTSTQAIERSEAFKTALLSSVSHDMRTPLSAISASASGLLEYEEKLGPEMRTRLLTTITEQCERLNRYTSNLLNLGRARTELSREKMPVIDIVEVLGRAVNGIRPSLQGREIVKRLPAAPSFMKADAMLLEQVFHNVLENAIFYSGRPSTIEVRLDSMHPDAEITITDEGVGIPTPELEKVFERFYQVEQPIRQPRGSGLGLAIAKAFTEAVGGRIRADSPVTPSGGTRISIILPLIDQAP